MPISQILEFSGNIRGRCLSVGFVTLIITISAFSLSLSSHDVNAQNLVLSASQNSPQPTCEELLQQYGQAKTEDQREAIRKKLVKLTKELTKAALKWKEKRDYIATAELCEKILTIDEKVYGSDHYEVAASLKNLAEVYIFLREFAKAEAMFQRALSIDTKHYGAEHPIVATITSNLAKLYSAQGNYAKAVPAFYKALEIYEIYQNRTGQEHPWAAFSKNEFGRLCEQLGVYNLCEGLFQESLENNADEPALLKILHLVQQRAKQTDDLSPEQQIIVNMSSYHLFMMEGKIQDAHQALAYAFALNAKVDEDYIKGRNYLQFMFTDMLDPNRDEVIDNLDAKNFLDPFWYKEYWDEMGLPAYWDNQWPKLDVEFTEEWMIARLLESLNLMQPVKNLELGLQVSYFIRTHDYFLSQLPLPEDVNVDKLIAFAEHVNHLLLLERALIRTHQLLLTQKLPVSSRQYNSQTEVLKTVFTRITPYGKLIMLEFHDSRAQKAIKEGNWGLAENLYRLSTALLNSSTTPFRGRNYEGATAWLQRAYINMNTGQLAAVTKKFLPIGFLYAQAVKSPERRAAMLGIYHYHASYLAKLAGNLELSNEHLRNSLEEFTPINNHNAIASWGELAHNLSDQKKPKEALLAVKRGLQLAKDLRTKYSADSLSPQVGPLYYAEARAYLTLEDWAGVKSSVDKGLATEVQLNIRALLLVYQGCVHKQDDKLSEAEQSFQAAYKLLPVDEKSHSNLLVNLNLGLFLDEAGRPREAHPFLERALTIHTALRKRARLSEAYRHMLLMGSVKDIEDILIKITYDIIKLGERPSELHYKQLLYYFELMKARSMTDEMESMRTGCVTYSPPGAESEIPIEMLEELSHLFSSLSVGLPMDRKVAKVFEQYQALVGEIAKRHKRPVLFFEYVPIPARDKVLLYVIDTQSVSWVELDVTWSMIKDEIAKFRRYIVRCLDKYVELRMSPILDERIVHRIKLLEQAIDSSSIRLGKILFPEQIPERATLTYELLRGKSLFIIPHGPMHNLPLAALKISVEDKHEYLVDIVDRLVAAPSFSTLRSILTLYETTLTQKVHDVLLVGDETDPSLPHVQKEFMAIRSVFDHQLPVTAKKSGLKFLVQKSPAVHFAVHGRLNREHPFKSGLNLKDGLLTVDEIMMFEAFKTRIVTMAACEAGEAKITEIGDDVWSLATGFMFAGVPAVIGAQWKQDGDAAALFYASFYKALADNPDIGTAVRTAMLAVRDGKNVKDVPGLLNRKNPSFWAGFHFLGE